MKVTILGASGFIGSYLVSYLQEKQIDYWAPHRNDNAIYRQDLGHVIYCIGLTADFRTRPFDTVDAHVCFLNEFLRRCKFNSFLYLSSTRIYGQSQGIAREEDTIRIQPFDFNDLYNISKAMGESICFASRVDNIRVARLSNVYGCDFQSKNFLFTLIRSALSDKKIKLQTSLDSAKDYINIKDVVAILSKIALRGKYKIYNVASGKNTTNRQIVNILASLTGSIVEVDGNSKKIHYSSIDVNRIKEEFTFVPAEITEEQSEQEEKNKNFREMRK